LATQLDLGDQQRPHERLLKQGAAALSNAELLAILLRSGGAQETAVRLAERILTHYDGLHGLSQASVVDLGAIQGLGSAKIAQIMAALELSKRLVAGKSTERPLIKTAVDAVHLVSDMAWLTQEHVRVILLDTAGRVIAAPTIYMGTINTSVLRIAEIYRAAITHNAPAFMLVHNHPSGDPTPSPEDVELTRALINAGRLLDITLLDHLIIGRPSWVSLRDLGFII
jgi:DNA repair protein RadC